MVESSIGVSAPLLIGEESLVDPVIGIITGIAYSGMRIYDKIRHKSKDDYSIDVLVDEEQKQPTDTTLQNWRNIRQRDAGHSQWSHQQPIQFDEEEPIPGDFGWEDVVPVTQDPAVVIENNEQVDHLNQVVVDVQIPLDQPVQQQPQQTPDEMLLFPRDYRPEDQNPDPNPDFDNDPNPNNNGGGNNDPDPGDNDPRNEQQEEQKEGGRIQDNPLFNNAINQIVNQISNLEKKKEETKQSDNDKERERYMADIEFQIRSQQSLIDLLTKFSAGQLDAKAVNMELDQIEQLLEQQKKDSFAEDFVFSDVIEMF